MQTGLRFLEIPLLQRTRCSTKDSFVLVSSKAKEWGCSGDDITIVSIVDFNAPGCRNTSSVQALCERVAAMNNIAPERNGAIALFPDLPRDSSLRACSMRRRASRNPSLPSSNIVIPDSLSCSLA